METEHEQGRGRERRRHRIRSRLQALSCQHRAWHRARTHRPQDHDLSWSQTLKRLSHPGTPSFLMFLFYFWERESVSRGGAEREGDTESEAGSRVWAVSTEPNVGLELTDHKIMTWTEVGCLTDWATQAPQDLWLSCQQKSRIFSFYITGVVEISEYHLLPSLLWKYSSYETHG